MCKVQMLRALLNQRLSAAVEEILVAVETTIAEYEEELCRSKEEIERQRQLLDAVFKSPLEVGRHPAGLFRFGERVQLSNLILSRIEFQMQSNGVQLNFFFMTLGILNCKSERGAHVLCFSRCFP